MATCTWQWCDWTDKWLHEGGTQRFALCTGQPQNTIVCKVCSCGTVQIGKMYSILPVGLKYCLQVELPLSPGQERGWLAIQWEQSMPWPLPSAYKWLLWDNVLSAMSQPWTKRIHRAQFGYMHHPTEFSIPRLCICVGRCMLLSVSYVTPMNKEALGICIIFYTTVVYTSIIYM